MLEVDEHRQDEIGAVEEPSDRHLDAGGELLQLEHLDLGGPALLVVLQHRDDVEAVLLLADERQDLLVLRPAARLHHVAAGVLPDERRGRVERGELPARQGRHAGGLHLLLTEIAVHLEPVGVARAADDRLPFLAQLLDQRPELAVVEHDDVGPVLEVLPAIHLLDEAVADVAVRLRHDVVLDLEAFLLHLPGEVVDEGELGDEQEACDGGFRGFLRCVRRCCGLGDLLDVVVLLVVVLHALSLSRKR